MNSDTGTRRRSSLFLIELMISIFFFAIASTVCIRLFAEAKLLSMKSAAQNQAVLQAQSAAAAFYAGNGTLAKLPLAFPEAIFSQETPAANTSQTDDAASASQCVVFFSEDWKNCASFDAAFYRMTVTGSVEDTLSRADIQIISLSDSAVLYELSLVCHAPRTVTALPPKGGTS